MKNPMKHALFLLSTIAIGPAAAAAQDVVEFPPVAQSIRVAPGVPIDGPPPEIGLIAVEPFDVALPVTGAPYTAEAVTERIQTLADGNRIEQRMSASVARDSRGRVRREHTAMVFGGPAAAAKPLVTISDPSAGVHITLDQERRVAHKATAQPPPSAGRILRRERPAAAEGRTEQLGEKAVEGVRATGTRTTMTIEANTIGNQLPIEVVSERWYSPELQVVVLTKRSDPRFGETVYRLTNIIRAEPPADLFEVPQDYRVDQQRWTPGRRVPPPMER